MIEYIIRYEIIRRLWNAYSTTHMTLTEMLLPPVILLVTLYLL